MGVYIRGMKMPTSCESCMFSHRSIHNIDWCVLTEKDLPCDCPLVPVPAHGDLIDADKLVELCDIMADKCDGIGASIWHQFKTTVEWSPIVIPAEEGE